jgi:thiol-disulfide isomerase/thioredoxin
MGQVHEPEAPTRWRNAIAVALGVAVPLLVGLVVVAVFGGERMAAERLSAGDARAATAPADDDVLVDGGWPEVAAYVRDQQASGRPTVVKFFASWCEPCKTETPRVLAVAAANPDVAFIGVAHADRIGPARDFVDEFGLTAMPTVFDQLGETAPELGVMGMPGAAFFDVDGTLAGVHLGPIAEHELQRWLDALTSGGPLPAPAA